MTENELALLYRCETCGVPPHRGCVTTTKRAPTALHAARVRPLRQAWRNGYGAALRDEEARIAVAKRRRAQRGAVA